MELNTRWEEHRVGTEHFTGAAEIAWVLRGAQRKGIAGGSSKGG